MKTGIGIRGHKRIIEKHRTGYLARCKCGWVGHIIKKNDDSRAQYRDHIQEKLAGLFHCKTCGDDKPLSEMTEQNRYLCKKCWSKKGNKWQRANRKASNRSKRDHHFRKHYGITYADSDAMLAAQGFCCAICRTRIDTERPKAKHVDHDHKTGRVRGILCFQCNSGLGSFKDDIARLAAAIEYLARHK